MSYLSLSKLLEAGVHIGHKASRWNPKMAPYIYKEIKNIHIIDLIKSASLLEEANEFVRKASNEKKTFLFIGTKPHIRRLIAREAVSCNSFYINYRWLGGMLTNWETVKNRIDRLNTLEYQELQGYFTLLTKKEASLRRKELQKLTNYLNGIKHMKKLPDIAIIIDQKREINAIRECRKLQIPIISIVDTNCDPDLIDIPIPANDNNIRSIRLILNSLASNISLNNS